MQAPRGTFAALLLLTIPLASPAAAAPADEPHAALRQWLAAPRSDRPALATQPFARAPLTRAQAAEARKLLLADHAAMVRETRREEWGAQAITAAGKTMRFKARTFGTKPRAGWDLFISMHGGGNAPARLNDQQWENQVRLYEPKDALYIAPRAPTNTWNLWHEPHIDELFDRLIETAIVLGEVNPDRVYLMGYSAGGDGVYQLAPRMADRFAAAAMMAGHPNDASPLGLRNLPFAIHVGERDGGYKRNEVAAEWKGKLAALRKDDPKGYEHVVKLHAGKGHWMDRDDREALDWMARFTRNAHPDRVVWRQASTTHDHFYWLAIPASEAKPGQLVIAMRNGQTIEVEKAEGVRTLTVLLNDAMLDLDRPVTVRRAGKALFQGQVPRTIANLAESAAASRGDPALTFDARVTVPLD